MSGTSLLGSPKLSPPLQTAQDLKHGPSHPKSLVLQCRRSALSHPITAQICPSTSALSPRPSPHLDTITAPLGEWEKASDSVHQQLLFISRESFLPREGGAGDEALPTAPGLPLPPVRDAGDAQRGGDALDRAVKGPWQLWPFPARRRGPGGSPHLSTSVCGGAGQRRALRGRPVAEGAAGLQIRAVLRRRGAFSKINGILLWFSFSLSPSPYLFFFFSFSLK